MSSTNHHYKFIILLLLVILLFGMLGKSQVIVPQEQVLTEQHTVIPGVKIQYDEYAKSWYSIYSNGGAIHVYLAVADTLQQRKITANGIELWIDTKGRKRKKTGILFPYAGKTEMKLVGFTDELNGIQNSIHASGLRLTIHLNDLGVLIYEAQVPLAVFSKPPAMNTRINIGIAEKGMPLPNFDMHEMPPQSAIPADEPPTMADMDIHLFEDTTIWHKFTLAAK